MQVVLEETVLKMLLKRYTIVGQNGFDSRIAGKYDSDRASWCYENGDDAYNDVWDVVGCKYGSHIKEECNDIRNNPVEIEDFSKLVGENNRTCYNAGFEDGETGKPFNKDRNSYCNEYRSQV